MKIKIKSDGTALGTEITNAETGESIDNVQALTIEATADPCSFKVTLELNGGPECFDIDVDAEATIKK